MSELYYTAPSDEIFEEVKKASIEVWSEKDSHPSYIAEKVERIESMQNISDNFMSIVAMFDTRNIATLRHKLSSESKKAIYDRLLDGGASKYDIISIIFQN